MKKAFQIGMMLAAGKSTGEIAQALGMSGEELLSYMDTEEVSEVFRRSIRVRQMSGYGLALERLFGQLASDNDATVLKAAHEFFGLMGKVEEAPFRIEEE